MSFDREWAQCMSAAKESASVRINSLDDGTGGRGPIGRPPGSATPDLHISKHDMVLSSLGLIEVMRGVRDTAIALGSELEKQKGMAGDDDAGRAFRKVYKPAATTTLDQMGESTYFLGETGRGLMRTARELLAEDSRRAAQLMGQQQDLISGMGDPGEDCSSSYLGLGQDLPEVVGDTAWYRQYAPGGGERYRGDANKVRDVAGSWRHAASILERMLSDAQTYALTANNAHGGEASQAFDRYFRRSVGFASPPETANESETLMANLVAACSQLAKACDKYAEHIDDAIRQIELDRIDLFGIEISSPPMFGGNGNDGGLNSAVNGDPHIAALGSVAHALDTSQARVKLPGTDNDPGWGLPAFPIPVPVPLRVPFVLASSPIDPSVPTKDPIAPDPASGHRYLTSSEQTQFRTWMNSLTPGGFAGGGDTATPANAYQLRVAGYPERELPLPERATGPSGKGMMADGLRPADGYVIDSKYVKEPNCENPKTFRSLQAVDKALAKPPKIAADGKMKFDFHLEFTYPKEGAELARYRAALGNPQNSQLKGLEIITNDKNSAAYWQFMMSTSGVKGDARYVP